MKSNHEPSVFAAINSATGQEVKLALQELMLTGRLLPVGASLQVRHVFQCAETKPVEVVYAFGLPRDAALRRFRIVGKGFSVMSELKPTAEAVKIYEEGIEAGSLSSLARQYRDGVVNLNVGNIRPGETVAVYLEILAGVELRDDGLRFRFPFTLAPTYHAQARTIEAEPGMGEMELPEEFGDVILPRWMQNATGLHRVGFDLTVALPQAVAEIGSPSHAITVRHEADGQHQVSLAPEKDMPDRDLVLDVRAAEPLAGVTGGAEHFALVVPSSAFGKVEVERRRLVFVVDRSGSMQGTAMRQARQAVEACLGVLSKEDAFGVVAFDDKVECLAEQLMDGSRESREAARKFLETVEARGGTELAAGFLAAAKLLGKDGGDVLVLTDGQVSGTETILAKARAAGIRIHCLGIGSASQDRFFDVAGAGNRRREPVSHGAGTGGHGGSGVVREHRPAGGTRDQGGCQWGDVCARTTAGHFCRKSVGALWRVTNSSRHKDPADMGRASRQTEARRAGEAHRERRRRIRRVVARLAVDYRHGSAVGVR